MHAIKIADSTSLVFQLSADTAEDNIDLNFYDQSRREVIFHMVLRRTQSALVFNTLHNGQWGNEEVHRCLFPDTATTPIEIRFDATHIEATFGSETHRFALRDGHKPNDIRYMLHAAALTPHSRIVGGQSVYWQTAPGPLDPGQTLTSRIKIESPVNFILRGSVARIDGSSSHLRLVCNGEFVEASAIFLDTHQDEFQADDMHHFELELPGYLWTHGDISKPYLLQLEFDERRMPELPIAVTAEDALEWLDNIALGPLGKESYWALLALEHGHFLHSVITTNKAVCDFLSQTANNYKLEDYLTLARQQPAEKTIAAPAQSTQPPLKQQLIWQAIRTFNAGIAAQPGQEQPLLARLLAEYGFTGESRAHFIENLTPHFCAVGAFNEVVNMLPSTRVQQLAQSDALWSASIALPFLVAQEQIEESVALLQRLGSLNGWLNTACMEQASKMVLAGVNRTFSLDSAEKFGYALISLLDKLREDYWSRLHDRHLMRALLHWIKTPEQWNRWLLHDLVKAVQRLYGMSPAFWQAYESLPSANEAALADLQTSSKRFSRLRAHILAPNHWSANAQTISDDLAYFQQLGNAEATQTMRELACHVLPQQARLAAEHPNGILDALTRIQPLEAVRLAAFPFTSESDHFVQAWPALRKMLADMQGEIGMSPRYRLQHRASALLDTMKSALLTQGNAETLGTTMDGLIATAQGLCDGASAGLGVDVVASACSMLAPEHPLAGRAERTLSRLFAQVLEATRPDHCPPQPLLAALARLRHAHPNAQLLGQQLEAAINSHFRGMACEQVLQESRQLPADLRLQRASNENDTLVVVYSCRPYLHTRIPAIRRTWMQDLKAKGIPCIVLVGGGDDTLQGDVLSLNVGDRYEDLPQKTLKLVDWVMRHTDFQYLLKIDDDCYLNADEYFNSQSHRKFHYYGRKLHRQPGTMDRSWHHDKSQGERAAKALDKSPEPSTYADGGGGYSLSRLAMQSLVQAQRTVAGKRLVASSFMEDKLVGDLLAQLNIWASNEDYYTLVRRRLFSKALPINIFDNTFLPSQASPTKLAHLDTDAHMDMARDAQKQAALWPKKIWPSYALPGLQLNSNQLELLTPLDKTERLLQHPLVLVAVMRNEITMLAHFVKHYRALGVGCFIVADNGSDDGTREWLFEQPDVVLYSVDTEYRHSHFGVAWQQAMMANHCVGKWVLIADADELLVSPQKSLPDITKELDARGHDSACVWMVDMYPSGDLTTADFNQQDPFEAAPWFDAQPLRPWVLSTGYYSTTRNFTSALRHRLMPHAEPHAFTSQKYCLLKYAPWMRLCAGIHDVAEINPAPEPLWFAHFKYHAGFKEKAETEVRRKQHYNGAQEYQKYLSLLTESSGNFVEGGVSTMLDTATGFPALAKDPVAGAAE